MTDNSDPIVIRVPVKDSQVVIYVPLERVAPELWEKFEWVILGE